MNTQNKLTKVRPPRVQITYDIEASGEVEKKELPFVTGVLGTFSGDESSLRERRFISVDKENFDNILEGLAPALQLQVDNVLSNEEGKLNIDLVFNKISDFSPDSIANQIEPLRNLLEIRSKLTDLKARALSNEQLNDRLNTIFLEKTANSPAITIESAENLSSSKNASSNVSDTETSTKKDEVNDNQPEGGNA